MSHSTYQDKLVTARDLIRSAQILLLEAVDEAPIRTSSKAEELCGELSPI